MRRNPPRGQSALLWLSLLLLASLDTGVVRGARGVRRLARGSGAALDARASSTTLLERDLLAQWARQERAAAASASLRSSASALSARTWAAAAFSSSSSSSLVGDGECFGLPAAQCKPCPSGETNMCAGTAAQCKNSFCSPLCTALAWSCDVAVAPAAAGFGGGAVTPAERQALCAQFVGHACAAVFKCCKADAALTEWVEGLSSDGETGSPLLPLAPCAHDPADAGAAARSCGACKSALALKLTAAISASACRFGSPDMPSKSAKPSAGGGTLSSLEERCAALARKLNAKLAAVMGEAGDMLCRCAGCCDAPKGKDTCYFPLTSTAAV